MSLNTSAVLSTHARPRALRYGPPPPRCWCTSMLGHRVEGFLVKKALIISYNNTYFQKEETETPARLMLFSYFVTVSFHGRYSIIV